MTVKRVPLGITAGGRLLVPYVNAYLVPNGGRWAIVDTGPPGCADLLLRALERHGIPEAAVDLILLTHGHPDHYGSVLELRRRLPGPVRIAMHPGDRRLVAEGRFPVELRPTSALAAVHLLSAFSYLFTLKLLRKLPPWPEELLREVIWLDPVTPADAPVPLEPLCGLEARALGIPGHSPGSIALLLPSGEMLIGDILSSRLPATEPARPMFVNDPRQVGPSLRRIAGQRPTVLWPGHGGPFTGEAVQRLIRRSGF